MAESLSTEQIRVGRMMCRGESSLRNGAARMSDGHEHKCFCCKGPMTATEGEYEVCPKCPGWCASCGKCEKHCPKKGSCSDG